MHGSYFSRRIKTAKAKILRVGELAAAAEAREREAWPEGLLSDLPLDFNPCFNLFLFLNTLHDITTHHLTNKISRRLK